MVLRRHQKAEQDCRQQHVLTNTCLHIDCLNNVGLRDTVAERLSAAVRIPTITHDGMGHVGEDPRWDIFYSFSSYLKHAFTTVYDRVRFETVNKHGLLYTWQGSDSELKPLLFMAHSDVVPASSSSTNQWTYDPFSGQYDGEYVWGRGSEDDKSNLIAILTAIEVLLNGEFVPKRTIILSVGFDEEGGAEQSYGARCLSQHLLTRYGDEGIEMIFDEGTAGLEVHFGTEFAMPATAEKGYIDVTVTVDTPGGHSSYPPAHTGIGYLAQAVQLIENSPFESVLTPANPTSAFLTQAALHSKSMPESLRAAILPEQGEHVIKYPDSSLATRALVRTSTAVDVIRGGDKVNSLPESAFAMVNHRIAPQDSVQTVKGHYRRILSPWARKQNLVLNAFSTTTSFPSQPRGTVTLTSAYELEPSPVSSPSSPQFSWLTTAIHNVFGHDAVVTPVLLVGNTDTRYYWDLSRNIYRMSPWRAKHDPRGTRMHTVDERMPVEGLMEMVMFYVELVKIVDGAGL